MNDMCVLVRLWLRAGNQLVANMRLYQFGEDMPSAVGAAVEELERQVCYTLDEIVPCPADTDPADLLVALRRTRRYARSILRLARNLRKLVWVHTAEAERSTPAEAQLICFREMSAMAVHSFRHVPGWCNRAIACLRAKEIHR